jgi:predicted ATPase/class 3 adenylate cyclase
MQCPSCNTDNPSSGRFCTQCGTALLLACPYCGVTANQSQNFCSECGASISRATRYVLSQSLADAQASPSSLITDLLAGSERRHLTVLFCDIVGSTRLAKTLDPEELTEITRSYYEHCGEAIHKFEGAIASYLGDGVMALFGYPRAHEDDAERAIYAALKIVHDIKALQPIYHQSIQVRIGIATGLVVVGADKVHALTKEKAVVGEAPNLASHLQAAAEPNTILISAATRELIGDVFVLEKLESASIKGGTGRDTVWRVLKQRENPNRFAARAGALTSFVGRDQEIALLVDRWELASQGEGQAILLSGEAGIGKSRVVEDFRNRILEERTELHLQCSPYHVDSALYPVITELRSAANLTVDGPPLIMLKQLEELLRKEGLGVAETIPLLASVLSVPLNDQYSPPEPDPQRRRELTLNVLVDRLVHLASKRPLLMIVEDLHWADPTTVDYFSRAMLRLSENRILLIMTHRPEFRSLWTGHAHVTALVLNRLSRRHCREMIESVANSRILPSAVVDQIIAKTDGVPLFVEELTKTVLESGWLKQKNGAWELDGSLPEFAIPATLQDSLMARLDRSPSAKEVAQLGAAIGREFSYKLLTAVSPMPASDLSNALSRLISAELVFAKGTLPATTYTFKHALVQDAAYETLLRSQRQQLHGRIAEALEAGFPEVIQIHPEILAHHYTEAGVSESAVAWWGKAGDLAIKRSANVEAVRHFGRAITLLQRDVSSREHKATELAMRVKMSGPLIATGGYVTTELSQNYERAWLLCNELGEEKSAFPIMYGQWVIPYVRGNMAEALANSERFLRQAERQSDTGYLMMGHRIYGASLVWRGDTLRGSEHLRKALSLYSASEHEQLAYVFSQHPRTAALAHLCLALQHLGLLDQAMEAGWEAISEARRIGHFNSIAYSLCFVSLLIMLRRETAILEKTAGELLQLAQEHRASYWTLWAKPMLGWIAAQTGKVEAGIRQMQESTDQLQSQKANLWVPQTLLLEAEILGKAEQYQRAYQLLDAAQALIEPLDQRFYEAELHRVRGAVIISENRRSAAGMASLDRAIDVARSQNSRFLELRACVTKARLWCDDGRRDAAREILAPVYHSFSEGLNTVDLSEARDLLEELA